MLVLTALLAASIGALLNPSSSDSVPSETPDVKVVIDDDVADALVVIKDGLPEDKALESEILENALTAAPEIPEPGSFQSPIDPKFVEQLNSLIQSDVEYQQSFNDATSLADQLDSWGQASPSVASNAIPRTEFDVQRLIRRLDDELTFESRLESRVIKIESTQHSTCDDCPTDCAEDDCENIK